MAANGVGEGEAGDFEAVPRGIDVLAGDEDVAAGGIGGERVAIPDSTTVRTSHSEVADRNPTS